MNTNTMTEFAVKVRCDGRTYTEAVYTIDAETAWGHAARIEAAYQRDYGYKARVLSVKEVK